MIKITLKVYWDMQLKLKCKILELIIMVCILDY